MWTRRHSGRLIAAAALLLAAVAGAPAPAVAGGLPDNRAYELLTPAEKGGAEDVFGAAGRSYDVGVAAAGGDEFLFHSAAAYGAFPAAGENTYVLSRGPGGWSAVAAASPALGVQSLGEVLYDRSGFSRLALSDSAGSAAGAGAVSVLNLLGPPGGPYLTIHSGPAGSPEAARLLGAAADLGQVVLGFSGTLYIWSVGGLHRLDVGSGGAPLSPCGAVLGGAGANPGAVSADGSRIFLTAPDPGRSGAGCWDGGAGNPPQLYMRVGGTATVELSAPEPGVADPAGRQPASFAGAAADGSKAFFLTRTELTADAAGLHAPELYEYDSAASTLTRVSRGESGVAEGDVDSVPAISADGRAVYFTARGRLTAGAPAPSGEEAGLYRYDTATGATAYVATVNQRDHEALGPDPAASWETTADGRFLLFASTHNAGGDAEVYRYDSAAAPGQRLTCISCGGGEADPGPGALFARSGFSFDNPAGTPPRAISADGAYVFFDTAAGLVPPDVNDRIDVYSWHEGALALLSSGRDAADSYFLDAGADGRDVFFGTHARLLAADADLSGDLYDARIGGGFAGAGGPGPCEGDACLNLPPAPDRPTPATAASPGPGNPKPRFAKRHHHKRHHHRKRKHHNHKRAGHGRGDHR